MDHAKTGRARRKRQEGNDKKERKEQMNTSLKRVLLIGTHLATLGVGFALGIYMLPILTAPDSPTAGAVRAAADGARFTGTFRRELADSDALHWGEGTLFVGSDAIAFEGSLAPGPDYRLYLSPEFVETESGFASLKSEMVQVGHVRTFENFMLSVPASIDPSDYKAAIVWCETFGQFITATEYQ
jgi:hypothetical protein